MVTGVELDPQKSWCYVIDFEFDGRKYVYRTIENMEGEYTLTDKHGNWHPLKRLEVSTGLETLGVFIAMDGNQEAQIKSLAEKSKSFAEKMSVK